MNLLVCQMLRRVCLANPLPEWAATTRTAQNYLSLKAYYQGVPRSYFFNNPDMYMADIKNLFGQFPLAPLYRDVAD